MTKTESIIGDIYDAWRAQDIAWLGSYLPDDFCHMVYFPKEIHPLGGLCRGKVAALQRWALVAQEHDLLRYDTSDLMIQKNRAGLEIIGHYRHKAPVSRSRPRSRISGASRTAGRSSSPNITTSGASRPLPPNWHP
jgi:hypothetical protein